MLYLPSTLWTRLGCGTIVDNLGLHEKLTTSTNLCVCVFKYMNHICYSDNKDIFSFYGLYKVIFFLKLRSCEVVKILRVTNHCSV